MVRFHDRVWGPDVSSWQGDVDWSAVKADGASFGITKVTEGVNYVNEQAAPEWAEMGHLGLVRVQYHYARPVRNSAADEADYFTANMLSLAPGDIVALDLEIDQRDGPFANGAAWARDWLTRVGAFVGFAPMLYCNGGILSDPAQRFAEHPEMGQRFGLWLANWGEVFPKPYAPWDTVTLWQFTSSGHVPGIDGMVDLNIFNGSLETMRKYGMPAGTTGGSGAGTDIFEGWTNQQFKDKLSGLISAVGYMGGDLANAMQPIISDIRLGGKLATDLAMIQAELRRVKKEQVG